MRSRQTSVLAAAVLVAATAGAAAQGHADQARPVQHQAQQPPRSPHQHADTSAIIHEHSHETGGAQYPGLGDLMLSLIQPRHEKLGAAGAQRNWPLAGYVWHELNQSFQKIGTLQKTFRGLSLPDMFDSTVGAPLHDLSAAIQARDAQRFDMAYGRLTEGCNACHTALEHPFIVIKTPDGSAFPNQDFRTPRP